jgi:hypothetical protein
MPIRPPPGRLQFTRYGDRYFLWQFAAPDGGDRCLPSKNEQRVAKEWMQRARAHGLGEWMSPSTPLISTKDDADLTPGSLQERGNQSYR